MRRTVAAALLAAAVLAACGGTAAPGRGGDHARRAPTPSASPQLPQSSLRNAAAPSARYGAALAYDPVSKQLILFGGATTGTQAHPADAERLNDTWAWNGTSWMQLHPAASPPPLYGASLVIDPSTGHLLLLAGSGQMDAGGSLQQQGTWSWDGQTWNRAGDTPLQMPFAAAGADPTHHQVLLSGYDTNYPTQCGRVACPVLGEIDRAGAYSWNGTRWAPAAGQAPDWYASGTAFDPSSGRVISAGGYVPNGLQSTFGWDGKQWQLVSQTQGFNGVPDPDYPASPCDAATDAGAGNIVMVCAFTSGGQPTGATWTFDGSTWTRASQAAAVLPAIASLSLADAPIAGAVVMVYPGPAGTEVMRLWNGSDWAVIPAV